MKTLPGLIVGLFLFTNLINGQVEIRDTTITMQHHSFELNDDNSIKSYSTNGSDIEQEIFSNSKVIENELIRLVVVPEYGARVLSFQYKPTGYEYLYQSECGSPYGIGDGNFYYDWLMVWGGIFPTFPEPEHGKTWLMPWKYSLEKQTSDSVIISMEYTDSTEFVSAPSKFGKGVTGITCKVKIGVYSGSSLWDFNVTLTNNKSEVVNYEYWTCTTLTPGSTPGNTGCPLNSEMVVPFTQYEADWSPGGWIGNYGNLYDMSRIDYLSKWTDMGIAYAHNLSDNYWGVINHDNEEGIMRISENIETPGMKFWTWGKDNVDNNLFDFSNGGADNYIELWAGVSESFFSSATLAGNQIKTWNEAYVPTTGLNSIGDINRSGVVEINWDEGTGVMTYNINTFRPFDDYEISLNLEGNNAYTIFDKPIENNPLGISEDVDLIGQSVELGSYLATLNLMDSDRNILLQTEQNIVVAAPNSINNGSFASLDVTVKIVNRNIVQLEMTAEANYQLNLIDMNGRIVDARNFYDKSYEFEVLNSGIYILQLIGTNNIYSQKIIIR